MDIDAQLALIAKVGLVFGAEDTFLSFPLLQPVSFPADKLDFSQALSDPKVMAVLLGFSRCVNACPPGPVFTDQGDAYLWERYDAWLSAMRLAASQLDPGAQADYARVKALLTTVDPATGLGSDSAAYTTYKQCRDAYNTALQAMRAVKLTADASDDPAAKAAWAQQGPQLQQALDAAEADWEGRGAKHDIEAAIAARARYDALDPASVWSDWRDRYQPGVDELTDPASGVSFAPSGFSPSNVSDQNWTELTLGAAEIKGLIAQAPKALQGLASSDGGSDIASISLEVRSVTVVRSWFDSRVFSSHFWQFPGDEALSDGGAPARGEWPAYVAAVVFARNIRVTNAAAPAAAPTPVRVMPPIRIPPQLFGPRSPSPIMRMAPVIARPPIMAERPIMRPAVAMFRAPIGVQSMAARAAVAPVAAHPMVAPVRPQIAATAMRLSPVSRLAMATFTLAPRPAPPAPPTAAAAVAPPPPPPPPGGGDISVLAFICRALPRTPDPDPKLAW